MPYPNKYEFDYIHGAEDRAPWTWPEALVLVLAGCGSTGLMCWVMLFWWALLE